MTDYVCPTCEGGAPDLVKTEEGALACLWCGTTARMTEQGPKRGRSA